MSRNDFIHIQNVFVFVHVYIECQIVVNISNFFYTSFNMTEQEQSHNTMKYFRPLKRINKIVFVRKFLEINLIFK